MIRIFKNQIQHEAYVRHNGISVNWTELNWIDSIWVQNSKLQNDSNLQEPNTDKLKFVTTELIRIFKNKILNLSELNCFDIGSAEIQTRDKWFGSLLKY